MKIYSFLNNKKLELKNKIKLDNSRHKAIIYPNERNIGIIGHKDGYVFLYKFDKCYKLGEKKILLDFHLHGLSYIYNNEEIYYITIKNNNNKFNKKFLLYVEPDLYVYAYIFNSVNLKLMKEFKLIKIMITEQGNIYGVLKNNNFGCYAINLENQQYFNMPYGHVIGYLDFLYHEKKNLLIAKGNYFSDDSEIRFYSRKINKNIIIHYCIFLAFMIMFSCFFVKCIPLTILLHALFLLNLMRIFPICLWEYIIKDKNITFHIYFILSEIIFRLNYNSSISPIGAIIISIAIPNIICGILFLSYIFV